MSDAQILNYVKASAAALGFELDDARLERVATHLARTAALAKSLESLPLDVADEPAEIYCPQAVSTSTERRTP
jgi:hypothetical protein